MISVAASGIHYSPADYWSTSHAGLFQLGCFSFLIAISCFSHGFNGEWLWLQFPKPSNGIPLLFLDAHSRVPVNETTRLIVRRMTVEPRG